MTEFAKLLLAVDRAVESGKPDFDQSAYEGRKFLAKSLINSINEIAEAKAISSWDVLDCIAVVLGISIADQIRDTNISSEEIIQLMKAMIDLIAVSFNEALNSSSINNASKPQKPS